MPPSHDRVCGRCGIGSLHWEKLYGLWKLHDSTNNLHACDPTSEKATQRAYMQRQEEERLAKIADEIDGSTPLRKRK